jgi:DNA transformation protein
MSELSSLPNVGRVLEIILNAAGIHTAEDLQAIGAKEAFLRIRLVDSSACVQMLYGLHGAVIGIRDCDLHDEAKNELMQFYNSLR